MSDTTQFDDGSNMPPSEPESIASENSQVLPMVLITLPQRAALIEYLAKQPYADVANGIDFLKGAPQINVTITPPDPSSNSVDEQP